MKLDFQQHLSIFHFFYRKKKNDIAKEWLSLQLYNKIA